MKARKAVVRAALVALGAAVVGPSAWAAEFGIDDYRRHGVTVATAGPGTIDGGIELPAEVRPNADRLAHVSSRFTGVVREARKQVGDRVRAGEVLAVVESDKLSAFELRAAFDGTVIDKHVAPGETVQPNRTAYIVADLSEVWVNIAVYQKALSELQVGRSVVVSTPDDAHQAEGTVSYVAPVVDQATRRATARVVLPNEDGRWRPGSFVLATVALREEAPVVVPRRAVFSAEGRDVVFVVEGGTFVARPVVVGRTGRTRVEVVSGLVAGETFADENAFLVKAELAKGDADHEH